jgi:glyoxylase-like metal-dependent hydrolase (beta-lactamase superfamily II)
MTRAYVFTTGTFGGPELLMKAGGGLSWLRLPMVCALVERSSGRLALIDTGLGEAALRRDASRFPDWLTRTILDMKMEPAETAVQQLARLGYRPSDVSDVILTHLHVDHCGALADFPRATVHVDAVELAKAQSTPVQYHPRAWAHRPVLRTLSYEPGGPGEFSECADVLGDGSAVALRTPGHTAGHVSYLISTSEEKLLHMGDAAVFADDLDGQSPPSPYARLFYFDLRQARASSARAARLGRQLGARIFTSHDPTVFAAMRHLPEAYGEADLTPRRTASPPSLPATAASLSR